MDQQKYNSIINQIFKTVQISPLDLKDILEKLKKDKRTVIEDGETLITYKNSEDIDFLENIDNSVRDRSLILPILPEILSKLLKLIQNDNSPFSMYSDIIKKDPTLTLKVLELANSTLYRGIYPAKTIQDALGRVGLNGVQSIVLSIKLKNSFFNSKVSQKLAKNFWKKSLLAATISNRITQYLEQHQEISYTLALLHNIGALIILNYPITYQESFKSNYIPELTFLKQTIDIFKNRVTEIVLKNWNFSNEFIEPIVKQNIPPRFSDQLLNKIIYGSIHLSNAIFSKHLLKLDKKGMFYYYKHLLKNIYIDIKDSILVRIINESLNEYEIVKNLI